MPNQWVYHQSFAELPDSSETDFTTAAAYVAGYIAVFQGNLRFPATDFFEISTTQIRFIDPTTRAAFTADASTNFLTSTGHGRSDDDIVTLYSTTTLPAGLVTTTKYYVINKTDDTFQISGGRLYG
jgi:hypothetical protein